MPYTNTWDDGDVLGSEAAKNIDDEFRRLKLDIHERMNDLVVDWEADPVVLKASGASSGSGIVVSFPAFSAHSVAFAATQQTDHILCPAAAVMNAPLMLPAGDTIKKVTWIIDKGTNTSVTVSLVQLEILTLGVIPTVVFTVTESSAGFSKVSSPDLTQAVTQDTMFYLQATCIGSDTFKIYGVRVDI